MTQSLNEDYETATVSTKVANCQSEREKSWKIIRKLNPLAKEITYGRLHTWEIYIRMSQNLRILQTCLQFLARGLRYGHVQK